MTNPHPRDLSIHDFTYPLPADRIAAEPLADRAASRLLVSRHGQLSDKHFRDLPHELPAGSLLIFNDTRVVRARLLARRPTGGQVELFCLEPVAPHRSLELALQQTGHCTWRCLVGNGRRWKEGPVTLEFETADGQTATLWAERQAQEGGTALIDFRWEPGSLPFAEVLRAGGHLPLPPYLGRTDTPADAIRYQTVYAAAEGAVAAPTAGLHFTPELLAELRDKGFETGHVTLHIGAGTFQPVKADHMADHPMHTEPILVTAALLRQLLAHRPRPVLAVGTTSLRTLESLYWLGVGLLQAPQADEKELAVTQWQPYDMAQAAAGTSPEMALEALLRYLEATGADTLQASTRLLIAPGYQFRLVDGLITNFHQPESTLLLLVAALLGPGWRDVYEHALSHGYRFLSYGDSSLLLPGTVMEGK
ncbi:S-adenosylmethionine:tRNA ribosyltransferase-isomerase [Hymenobacter sp. BT770]|uniref:S-adenosylmethionine:tRNA ribosyltransferase-isomerase n=1 Tax=Hymenobacter sp. BT770 TaxID=2886942 RepID=UPI001D0F7278|nr:S-adenosylmethionine:tRNA ribosyltransferase-isomerase [Hymenobacter sp. BT770]MCC3152652.1 S-adenosylmethionine:tRNA ribosyltransferase-isomerase [Hymenobacter sp. BT770]MDO3414725.1 S-adenosylmethionine:tRNA ribosyltransferase-isomerase [Hymenobacter sp. BT770]